ncbi:MAG: hypothetical protein ACRDX9_08515 [Acidimicrobiia bacterium]
MKAGLRVALELVDLGAQLHAQRHRRKHPGAPEEEVRAVVLAWLRDRPMAPDGDAVGSVTTWPRTS